MSNDDTTNAGTNPMVLILAWLAVGLPLLWGIGQTVTKAAALFH